VNSDLALHVLLALAVVVMSGRLLANLLTRIGQPPVIGEVLSGILLGPSLLGRLAPGTESYLFPMDVRPSLAVIAEIGVVLYMFLVGLEFDPGSLRRRAAPFIFTSQVSIVLPFALGVGLAFFLFPDLSQPGVRFLAFALFLGIAMSITAFPVLARILTDRGLSRTELGVAALTCAAVGDVTGWCLLAVVVGMARATLAGALMSSLLAALFIVVMFAAGRPLAAWITGNPTRREASVEAITWTLAGMLLSAVVAELIGIHAIFGAFMFGAIMPAEGAVARFLRLERAPIVTILFLPAFFALTGLRTEISLVSSVQDWLICVAIIALATAGKLGGTFIAGRVVGMPSRFAARLGVLMNTRGLMELVVLNVGMDIGVISQRLFTMMVIMAIVTTAITAPLLDLIPEKRD